MSNQSTANAAAAHGWPSRRVMTWLILIILLGAALRFHGLTDKSIWYDEGANIMIKHYVNWQLDLFRADVNQDLPLMPVLLKVWYDPLIALFGITPGTLASDFVLKLLPCLFGIATIPLVFAVTRLLLRDDQAALLTAFLYAISPFHVYYGQEVRTYFVHVPCLLAAMWCYLRMLETDQLKHWAGWILFLSISMYNHPVTPFTMAVFNLNFLVTWPAHRRSLRRWLLSQIWLVVLCLPALYLLFRIDAVFAQGEGHWYPRPTLKTGALTFKAFFAGYSPNPAVYWPLFVLTGGLFVLGLASLRKRWVELTTIVLHALLPILIGIVIWQLKSFPMYQLRFFIFSGVFAAMGAALGIRALPRPALRGAALAAICALTAPALGDYYANRIHPVDEHRLGVRHKVANREAAAYILEDLEPGELVGHSSHFTLLPFYYYMEQAPFEVTQHFLGFTEQDRVDMYRSLPAVEMWDQHGLLPTRIEPLAEKAEGVWLVQSWWEPEDVQGYALELRNWLDARMVRQDRATFDGIVVYRYRKAPELRAEAVVDRVADAGAANLLYYRFGAGAGARAAEAEWRREFARMVNDYRATDPPVYAVDFDVWPVTEDLVDDSRLFPDGPADGGAPMRVTRGYPFTARGPFTVRVAVRNAVPHPVTIAGRWSEAVHVFDPHGFERAEPELDVWRPRLAFRRPVHPWYVNLETMIATIREGDGPESGAIHQDTVVPAGSYTLFVRLLETGAPQNESRARLTFSISHPDPGGGTDTFEVGSLSGNRPGTEQGVYWRALGSIEHPGGLMRLTVRADNPDGLAEAHAELHRVALVPQQESRRGGAAYYGDEFEVSLAPHEVKFIDFGMDLGDYPQKRLDFEFEEYSAQELRHIYCHIERREQAAQDVP